jgi:hypothetical protein
LTRETAKEWFSVIYNFKGTLSPFRWFKLEDGSADSFLFARERERDTEYLDHTRVSKIKDLSRLQFYLENKL